MENVPDSADLSQVYQSDWSLSDSDGRTYIQEASEEIASIVRTTLGPRGMKKQIYTTDSKGDPQIVVTKDAGRILDALQQGSGFSHPAAALFVDSVDTIQRSLHDGTTSSILLSSNLVSNGIELIEEGLSPADVLLGYSAAANRAGQVLDDLVYKVKENDRETLLNIARTTLPENMVSDQDISYCESVVDAVQNVRKTEAGWIDTDTVKVISKIGDGCTFYRGVIVQRRPQGDEKLPNHEFDWTPVVSAPLFDSNIALIDREIELSETAVIFDQGVQTNRTFDSNDSMETYRRGERNRLTSFANKLQSLDVDILASQEKIDDTHRSFMERNHIAVVDAVNLPERDIDRLAAASGGRVVARIDDLTSEDIGVVGKLSEKRVGDEKWAIFEQCSGEAATIVVEAATEREAADYKRAIEDAVEVIAMTLVDEQTIPGAGAPAMAIAADLRTYARSIPSREHLAIHAFADSLEDLVVIMGENMGFDRTAALSLREVHSRTETPSSVGLGPDGTPVNAREAGVIEPRRVFSHAIETGRSVAEQLLTIDGVLYPNVDTADYSIDVEHE